jgi:PAT family beta-lactamase induction signal transducer AmpG
MGPLVDNLHLRRFGARKQWIVAAQIGMLLTLCMALLRMPQFAPDGVIGLGMVVSTIIGRSLGMTDGDIVTLNLVCTAIWVPCCLAGGWLSDRFGRRLTLGLFAGISVLPGLWMGWQLKQAGWDHPPEAVDGVWPREDALIRLWWIAAMIYSVFNGLMYSVKTAFFMDIVNPKIAGTHFTALMAMNNLVITYTAIWQGSALSTNTWAWTLWEIFLFDTLFGLAFLAVIPFVKPKQIHLDS